MHTSAYKVCSGIRFRFTIYRWCLQIANAIKNQQNTIKILLIISST